MAKQKQTNSLVIVDIQNDFMDVIRNGIYPPDPTFPMGRIEGHLPVPGAYDAALKIAAFIRRNGHKLDDISPTHDMHKLHIATPIMWVDRDGNHPAPFSQISYQEAKDGKWRINSPHQYYQQIGIDYLKTLQDDGRYVLTIWFPHCPIGGVGAAMQEDVFLALRNGKINTWQPLIMY